MIKLILIPAVIIVVGIFLAICSYLVNSKSSENVEEELEEEILVNEPHEWLNDSQEKTWQRTINEVQDYILAAEKAAAEKAEAERKAAEERARIAEEKRLAAEKAAAEKAEQARLAAEAKAEAERKVAEEKKRLAEEKEKNRAYLLSEKEKLIKHVAEIKASAEKVRTEAFTQMFSNTNIRNHTEVVYSTLLSEPKWQEFRAKILLRDNYQCIYCGKPYNLHVHHKYYSKYPNGRKVDPWNYPETACITLCADCHKRVHTKKKIKVYYRKYADNYGN